MRSRNGQNQGQYPGRGPFSNLPPWQRPGWGRGYRRGYCARYPWLPRGWWADPAYTPPPATPSPQDEVAALEDYKKTLAEDKTSIEQEINDVDAKLKELKIKSAPSSQPVVP
jgi:hypothetical protein